jgi:hypothetical protein
MTKQRDRHISDRKFQERYEERRRRHEAQKNARQAELDAVFGRMASGDQIRGGHYGQRSCEPHEKAEHMAAPTSNAT